MSISTVPISRPELIEARSESTLTPGATLFSEPGLMSPPFRSPPRPMPDHWKPDFDVIPPLGPLMKFLFRISCVIAIGRADLKKVWEARLDEAKWADIKKRLAERVAVITLVAGLVLPFNATFLCASPPRSNLLDFTQRAPYICMMLSLALSMDGVIVGACLAYVATECTRGWFEGTLMSSRSRVCCTLAMVAFPSFCLIYSMVTCAIGLIIAAWYSGDKLIRVGSMIAMLVPVPLVPLFVWTQFPVLHVLVREKPTKNKDRECSVATLS